MMVLFLIGLALCFAGILVAAKSDNTLGAVLLCFGVTTGVIGFSGIVLIMNVERRLRRMQE